MIERAFTFGWGPVFDLASWGVVWFRVHAHHLFCFATSRSGSGFMHFFHLLRSLEKVIQEMLLFRCFAVLSFSLDPMTQRTLEKHVLLLLSACYFLFMFSACNNPLGEGSIDVEERQRWAVPLLQTQFTLEDALGGYDFEGTLLDQDGLRLVRRDTVFREFPIQSIDFPGLTAPLTDSVTDVALSDFGINLPVQEIEFLTGTLDWAFASNDPEALEVELKLPNFTIGGDTLTITGTVPPGGSITDVVDLGGHVFSVDQGQRLFANYTARTPSGEPRLLQFVLIQLNPDYTLRSARGALDSISVSLGNGIIVTDFFQAFEPNTGGLRDASVVFEVVNQTTVPFNLESVRTYASLRDGSEFDFRTPMDAGVPITRAPGVGQSEITNIVIDDTNSGLVSAATMFPDSITLDLVGIANPDRLSEVYVIDYQEEIIGSYVFNIPLEVQFDGFAVNQDFTFGEIDGLDRVREVEIQLASANSFGLSAAAQIYILNDSLEILDSLFMSPQTLLTAGALDPDGNVVTASDATVNIPINDETFNLIREFPRARARVFLNTPEGRGVYAKLENTNSLSLNVGLSFEYVAQ